MSVKHYEVIVVGGGISGAALFFELAKYSDINNICLLEKYDDLATHQYYQWLQSFILTLNNHCF